MLKYILYTILLLALIGAAFGGWHLYKVSSKNKKEMSKFAGEEIAVKKNFGKVLVVYYSMSGHTKDIAEQIQNKTNADLYEIKTNEPMPKGPKMHMAVKKQLKEKKYPEIKQDIPNFEQYDTVFVGAPVWWYTIATPALSFLDQADFMGKKVVPFSTQGSNVGTYFEDFAKLAKNAKIQKSAQFNNMPKEYDQAVNNKISAWLNEL